MKRWDLLVTEENDPFLNLALEEVLAVRVGKGAIPPILRLWRNGDCFVIGRLNYRRFAKQVERLEKEGFSVVERLSGGEAIFQDEGCLNFSIIVPRPYNGWKWDKLEEIFKVLCSGLIKGLEKLGIYCEHSQVDSFCSGPYDLATGGKKIAGVSLALRSKFVLIHGTLIVNTDLKKYVATLKKFYGKIKEDKITSLEKEAGKKLQTNELFKNILGSYADLFSIKFVQRSLSGEEKVEAEKLRVKYQILEKKVT